MILAASNNGQPIEWTKSDRNSVRTSVRCKVSGICLVRTNHKRTHKLLGKLGCCKYLQHSDFPRKNIHLQQSCSSPPRPKRPQDWSPARLFDRGHKVAP